MKTFLGALLVLVAVSFAGAPVAMARDGNGQDGKKGWHHRHHKHHHHWHHKHTKPSST